jgi:hypothetical protein
MGRLGDWILAGLQVFPLGASILKNFMALAVMQLHGAGRLSIHQPLHELLPHLPLPQVGSSLAERHHDDDHDAVMVMVVLVIEAV